MLKEIGIFVAGMLVGGTIGTFITTLCIAAKDPEENISDKKVEFRCKNTTNSGCGAVCCGTCLVSDACTKDNKCKNNPLVCGKSLKIK